MLAVITLAVCGCASADPAAPPVAEATAPVAPTASVAPPAAASSAAAPATGAVPTRVGIPALGLDEALIGLGIDARGAMEVPTDYDDVGWFTGGGRPGGTGPTVIAAHVDSPTGPAAFVRLAELEVGELIEVQDSTGTTHTYRVSETADYPKADFPTARVFGATARDELRLITCGGIFDRDAGAYEDNHVVFAERA